MERDRWPGTGVDRPEGSVLTELTIGEVGAVVGVSPHTLRAWERRHGVVLPRRSPSNQRRYTVEDVRVLQEVKEMVRGGGHSVKHALELIRSERQKRTAAIGWTAGHPSVWRIAMDLVPEMVLLIDGRGLIMGVNAAVSAEVGVAEANLCGGQLIDLVVRGQRTRAAAACGQPWRRRRGLRFQLTGSRGPTACEFDCWPLRTTPEMLLLVGRPEPASSPLSAGGAR